MVAVLLATLPWESAPAGAGAAAQATTSLALAVVVGADGTERMTLTLEGLTPQTRYDDLCLPNGAEPGAMRDALGGLGYIRRGDRGRQLVSFSPRASRAVLEMTRAGPIAAGPPIRNATANLCTFGPANEVNLAVTVPERHRVMSVSPTGVVAPDGRSASARARGPVTFEYAYEAPLLPESGLVAVDVPPLRAFVAETLAANARRVLEASAPLVDRAVAAAGLRPPSSGLYVNFSPERRLGWELGHHVEGPLFVVHDSTLGGDAAEGFPYVGVTVVLHEAFHAVSDPHGSAAVTARWFLEGSAIAAERVADEALPGAWSRCEKETGARRCRRFDSVPTRAEVEEWYRTGFRFDPDWDPATAAADDRRSYQYSGFLVAAYVQRFGPVAYQRAWAAVQAALDTGAGCPCDGAWLARVLVEASDGRAGPAELYYPYRALLAQGGDVFAVALRGLVREDPAPSGGGDPNPIVVDWTWLLVSLVGAACLVAAVWLWSARRRHNQKDQTGGGGYRPPD